MRHGEGPGMVIAGPGAGKTAVLRERMFNLVQREGIEPSRILTLAFNKEAALELFERSKDIGKVQVQTVHSLARDIIKDNLEDLGFPYTPQVPEEGDRLEGFSRRLMANLSETGQVDKRRLDQIVNEINVARANVTEGLFDPETLKGDAKTFAIAYETFKRDNRYLDFQDMLLYAADLLERRPDIREGYRRQFDFIQIDEFQDVSESDFRFLNQLGKNLFAVGDDDQTIYSFRTGAGELMHEFAKQAELYEVTENFRSRPEIVEAARKIIEGSRKRLPKDLRSTRDPGGAIRYHETTPSTLQSALEQELVEGAETAILTRTNYEASQVMNMLEQMPELKSRVSGVQTLHSSKGLEFDRVILLLNTIESQWGGLYRSFPSATNLEELEEERRLFYVGMTRAKEELIFMGKDPKFLAELGFEREPPPVEAVPEDLDTVNREAVEASRTFRQRMERGFHEFRARYQKLRTYQDLVDMERLGDIPSGEIIENLSFAQVHREKIEELGRELGLEPAARTDRPTRLRGMDRFLANIHRPGKIQIAGYGGLVGADVSGVTRGLGLIPRTVLGLGTASATRGFRMLDEFLYPHVRRPGQQLDYRELHQPLPDVVAENLPEGIDPSDFRLVEPRFVEGHRPRLYEFAHPTEGWRGDPFERPLFHEGGFQYERLRSQEEMRALYEQGLLTERHTYLDTSQSGANLRITPYDAQAQDRLYQPPTRPRSERELSVAALEYMEGMRDFLEGQRTSARRPSVFRHPNRRWAWEREHRRLLRPRLGTGIEQFLSENRGRDVVDFEQLHRVLTRLNPENTRLTMGLPFGGQDMAAQTIGLHTEVLNLLERVYDPASPYFGTPTDILAGGRLHQLPDGREGTADPDGIPRVDTPRLGLGQRLRGAFARDRFRSPFSRFKPGDPLERAGLMLQTYDEMGQKVRPGSAVYLGQGRVATALHTQLPQDGRTPVRATVQSVRGGEEIDVTGFLDFDEQLDLAILNLDQTNEAIKNLESVPLGRGWIGRGRGLRTMGAGQFVAPGSPEHLRMFAELSAGQADDIGNLASLIGEQTRIRMPFSTTGTRGSVAEGIGRFVGDVFPVQSGSGVFSRGFFGDRLQGIIGGRGAGQGFYYPVQAVRRLLGRRGAVGGYQDVVSQFTPDTESVITGAVESRLEPLIGPDRDRQLYQLLTAREEYLGGYAPEMRDLETRIYGIHSAGIPDAAGLEEIAQAEARLSAIRRPLEGEQGLDAQIRGVYGADAPHDLADLDARVYSRGYQLGQRLRDTRLGRGASRVLGGVGRFSGSGAGRFAGRLGKLVGKVAPPGFELLDFADKVDYLTGGAAQRITQEAVESDNLENILSRFELLQQERAFHTTTGGLDVVGRLLGTDMTAFEADYFEREGGLRDIGSLWSGLEWAERLPIIDPVFTTIDKIEKGILGRVFDAAADPTGQLVAGQTDVQLGQLQEILTDKRIALTSGQQERFAEALRGQRASLVADLSAIAPYDEPAIEQKRADIESELKRLSESEDKMVRVVGGMGDSFVSGGFQFRSRTARIKELEHELSQLPNVRPKGIMEKIQAIDTQLAALDSPVAPVVPVAPVIPSQLERRELPRIGPITPLTLPDTLPRISVTPLTEPLTGAELEAERARRMGVVPAEEQAMVETEAVTAPARRAMEADQEWRYRFPELVVPRDGQSYFRGEGAFTYRHPPIHVEGQRYTPGVSPVSPVSPTAPYTAPLTPTPAGVEDTRPRIGPITPLTMPERVPGMPSMTDTSMGLFRGMEQTDLNRQPYLVVKDLEDAVIDGDTLKGMLFAPRLGIVGQEERIRYLGFDSAERDPRGMQRYMYNRKFRTESAVTTEERKGREATEMHREFLEQFKVGDEYRIPLEMDEFQRRGKYGRVLANPLGVRDTYFKEAIETGVARVYGSSAFLGGETTLYDRMYTEAEKEKAKRHYGRVDEDILRDARKEIAGEILAPALDIRSRFEGMDETYTQTGLIGTGIDGDFGLVGEAYAGQAQSRINLEAYQEEVDKNKILLKVERDKFLRGDVLEPSVEQSNRIKAFEEAIRIAEEGVQAEQRAIKEYQRVIDQSSRLVQNLRKELLQSKLAILKDERQFEVAGIKEETAAIHEQVKEQSGFRKGFGKEVLGDVGFMTRFETDHRTGLIAEQGGVTANLTGVRAEIEAQQGLVDTKRTAWQEAFAAYEEAPGKETGDALNVAEDAYNAEKANLQHLQAMEQLYSRKLGILEAGIQTSESASDASKRIAEALEVEAQKLAARESRDALTETFEGIREGYGDLRSEGRFSQLRNIAYIDPQLDVFSDVQSWVDSSREQLGEEKVGIEASLEGLTPELEADKTALADLREQLKGEMAKDEPDAALIGKLSADIESKQKIVDTQQKIVDDYKEQLKKINEQLDTIQKQLDVHKEVIDQRIAKQSYDASKRVITDDKATMKELLKTPYADFTDEQKADLQKFLQADQGDAVPEHIAGFKERFIAEQAKDTMTPALMAERYGEMSLEQLQAQMDPETGEFIGLSGRQAKLAEERLKEVISPEQYVALHDKRKAAFEGSPEGLLKQTLKDRQEAEREAKRRQQYAERQQLREDTRHIDMLSKPLVQMPGRFIRAFDARGQVERTGRMRLSDLREDTAERKRDVMEDANLTIRQRTQQLERIEKESAKRRIQIEKDIAEAKKKAFSDVLDSFKNMFRDMLIRETEYMAQSQIREWWLGRQGWEQDGYGGYQRRSPGGGGGLTIPVTIPGNNQPVRSDSGRTFVGSPTGYSGGHVVQSVRSPLVGGGQMAYTTNGRFYAPDGRIFADHEAYERQMKLESGDRGTGFDIAANIATLGIHQLGEEHLWSRWDDADTGERPFLAQAGQFATGAATAWGAKKYMLGPAWDFAKGLFSSGEAITSGGEVFGPAIGEVSNVLPEVSSAVSEVSSVLPDIPLELQEVAPVSFEPITTTVPDAVSAIPDIPPELQQVADVNFEPVTRGLSDATKQGIEEGMRQVDGDPLMKVVENSGKEGAQGFWQGLMENPAVEVGGDALSLHSAFKGLGHLVRDQDSIEARAGQETNPYNILIDEIFGSTWGEFGGNLWQGAKNVGGFAKELGGGAVDFLGDIGGFVADIPGTLNRTSGTGNWFTQTAKDVGGFLGDTFGKDSWRTVTDMFAGMGDWFSFDHPVNDDIARRASARYVQRRDAIETADL